MKAKNILHTLVLMLFSALASFAQTPTGPNDPSASTSTGGGIAWGLSARTYTQDNLFSNANNIARWGGTTQFLTLTGFGFALPVNAVVRGVYIEMDKFSDLANTIQDNLIQLTIDGTTPIGNNYGTTAWWRQNDGNVYVPYGGANDLWGTTLTKADVESGNFGVIIQAINPSGNNNRDARIDHVRMTVYYDIVIPNIIITGSANLADNSCDWRDVSDITITEGGVTNFAANQTNQTYVLTFSNPALFDFNTSAGSVAVSAGDITASSISITNDAVTITMSTDALADQLDVITISGLQVKSTGATAGAYTIIESGSSGSWNQLSLTHADLIVNAAPTVSGGNGAFVFGDPSWVTVSDIVINENISTNFAPNQTNKTYVISTPADYLFNTGVVPTVTRTGGTSITINSTSFVGNDLVLDLTTDASTLSVDQITISGLQVKQVSALSTQYLQYNCALSTGSWGMKDGGDATINHGTLSLSGPFISNGTGGGDWNTGTTWQGGIVPSATDNVIILEGDNVTVSNSNTCANLTSYGTVSIIGNKTLTITGNMTMDSPSLLQGDNNNSLVNVNGDFTIFDGSTINGNGGTLQFNISGNLLCSAGAGVSTFGEVNMTVTGLTTVDGEFTFGVSSAGRKNFVGGLLINPTGVLDNTVGEDPRIDGDLTNNGSWIGCTGGTCKWTFGRNLNGTYIISGNPVEFSQLEARDATDIIINNGTVVISRNNNGALTGNGVFTNNGSLYVNSVTGTPIDITTFNASNAGNYVYFNGAGNQGVISPDDNCYYNLIISTSGTKTPAGSFGIKNSLSIIDDAIFDIGTATINDGCGGTASLQMSGNSQFIISKCSPTVVPELTGAYSLTGGTIVLDGVCGGQILRPNIDYYNLLFNGTSTVTMTNITTINGDFTISGSADFTGNSVFTMDCSKTFTYNSTTNTTLANDINIGNFAHTNTGDIIDNANTITVCGSSWDRSVAVTTDFVPTGTVVFNPAGGTTTMTSSAAANITRFHNVIINPSKTLVCDLNGINIGNSGNGFFTNNGTFDHNNSTVTVVGNCTVDGATETTFNNLTINNTFTLTGHATNMNIVGNWRNNNGVGGYTHNSGKVSFTGGNAQTMTKAGTETFFDVLINKTVNTTLSSSTTTIAINNSLLINEGIFDINTNTLNGTGSVTMLSGDIQLGKVSVTGQPEMSGIYTLTGGTITLDGAGNQTLRPNVVYNNLVYTTSGIKTMTNVFTINGNITVSGSATIGTHSSFTQASDKNFNYLSTGSTTLTAATPITIGSYFQTLGTFNINGNDVTVKGSTWNRTGGTFSTTGRVIFNASVAQFFNHTPFAQFQIVQIDNPNNVTLNSIMYARNLELTDGNIITGANMVILPFVSSTVTRINGHVDGYLRKSYDAANTSMVFEIGTGADYSPATISFAAVTVAGTVTCKSTSGEHFDIYSSLINPGKSVNRYWEVTNTTGFTTYDAKFDYPSSDVDFGADFSNFSISKYTGGAWTDLLLNVSAQTSNSTTVSGLTPLTGTNHFAIGENYIPEYVTNAVSGAMIWDAVDKTVWIRERIGTITYNNGSTLVTGVGTDFVTEVSIGDVLLMQTSPSTVIGTVASITDATTLNLTANATASNTCTYGIQTIPKNIDYVTIGNPFVGLPVDITLATNPTVLFLKFKDEPYANTLTHNGNTLTANIVYLKQPSANNKTNLWTIDGTALIPGSIQIASNDATVTRIARIDLTGGLLDVGNLKFDCSAAAAQTGVISMSAGGQINLSGSIILNNNAGTISQPDNNSIFNFDGAVQQTINTNSSIVYNTVTLNNSTNDNVYDLTVNDGVILNSNITTLKVTGDILVQSGIFDNNGFSIAGNAGKSFQVQTTSKFLLRNSSSYPTGFGTFLNDATSETHYLQTVNSNISTQTYGVLYLTPLADAITLRFSAGAPTIQGNLYLGNVTNTGIIIDANLNGSTVNAQKDVVLNANTTYSSDNINTLSVGGNWDNEGGTFTHNNGTIRFNGTIDQEITGTPLSQTFYNFTVDKTAGTLSVTGSTTSLTVNNYSHGQGTFTSPNTFNINGNLTISSGVFNAGTGIADGSYVNIKGSWTNNGGTFTNNNNTVNFNNTTTNQSITGTVNPQIFGKVELANTGRILSTGGSTVQLDISDLNLTATAGTFTSPATVNIGNLTVLGGIYTPGANTNIQGNVTYNGGTLTWGTNVTLNGTSQQSINGTLTIPTFTNFTINNSDDLTGSAIILNKPIKIGTAAVAGVFTLTDGHILTDATNKITLSDPSTVVLNAPVTQDSSFVRGPMSYEEDDNGVFGNKIFPVGNKQLLHKIELNVKQSAAGTNTYTAEYYLSTDAPFATTATWTLPASISHVSSVGHWDLSKSGAVAISNANVKLYYVPSDGVTDPANLVVAKGNPSTWTDLGGAGSAPGTGFITSSTNFITFSRFSHANKSSGTNPLPVELLDFTAKLNDNVVDINWTTVSEKNNDYFVVQRTQDMIDFEDIAIVDGNGNSAQVINYSAIDENPLEGISYYVLKQVDFDGKINYSNFISIDNKISSEVTVRLFPNPAESGKEFFFEFNGLQKEKEILVVVLDVNGRELYSKVSFVGGCCENALIAIDPYERLKPGIYFVVGSSNDAIFSKKLIIK